MKKNNTKTSLNEKNLQQTNVSVVELGKVNNLTLGGGTGGHETRHQPFGCLAKN